MKLHSNSLSGPKIKAFLKVMPLLMDKYKDREFDVYDAIRYVNANPELKVWCYRDGDVKQTVKARKESEGFVSLNLQNACHCFAGRFESRVVDKNTGKTIQLLDKADHSNMTYRIRKEHLAETLKEA